MNFILTSDGTVIKQDILERYSIKNKKEKKQVFTTGDIVSPSFTLETLKNLANQSVWHDRAIAKKASDIVGAGWAVKSVSNQNNADEVKEMIKDLNEDLIYELKKCMIDYFTFGFNFLEVHREESNPSGNIDYIGHVDAHTIRFLKGRKIAVQEVDNKKVFFKEYRYPYDVHREDGTIHSLDSLDENKRANEFYSEMEYAPGYNYYGRPCILPAVGAIYGDISRRDYNISFFDNYTIPAFMVTVSGNYQDQKDENGKSIIEKAIVDEFEKIKTQKHGTMVLGLPSKSPQSSVEVNVQKLSTDVKEASFRMYRVDNRDEILAAHEIPPYRLGISEEGSLGGNLAEESTEIYKRSIIKPRQARLERFLNSIIENNTGELDYEFKFESIDIEDESKELEMMTKLFEKGAVTPNELIQYFGNHFNLSESGHPLMNCHYINNQPVDYDLQEGEYGEEYEEKVEEINKEINSLKSFVEKEIDKSNKRWF